MKITHLYIMVFLSFVLFSCKNEQTSVRTKTDEVNVTQKQQGQASIKDEVSAPNALQVAKSLDDFSTLVTAIEAAGVQDAVVNAGPLTIFAPTNAAFDKLPAGTLEDLLKPENKEKLAHILVNHVAPANYPIKQLKKEAKKGRKLYMASGEYLPVDNKDGEIFVGGKKVVKTVDVSNGWVHVIEEVMIPEN
ncbi:MAG: fasciclin [Flavobacteriia bacterium]|nr:MAG: fasciclin [Flavobacteriia bacterium]